MQTLAFLVDDFEDAATWLFETAKECPDNGQTLIQVFSHLSADALLPLVEAVKQRFPHAHILGMSSQYVIYQGEIHSNHTLITVSQFSEVVLHSGVIPYQASISETCQQFLDVLNVAPNTRTAICFADDLDASLDNHNQLFADVPHHLSICGGIACVCNDEHWVLHNGAFYQRALVAVTLTTQQTSDLSVSYEMFTEWNPIGKYFSVTHSEGNTLVSLDNQSVVDIYRHYLGHGQNVSLEIAQSFPLVCSDDHEVYLPLHINADGSVRFDKPLPQGERIRFSYDHPALTIEQVLHTIQPLAAAPPEHIFVYNCVSRLRFMEGNRELSPLQNIAPTSGCYCFGEFCRNGDAQKVLHHSMTYLALSEKSNVAWKTHPIRQFDNSAMPPLFSLIRNAFTDLDEMNMGMEQTIRTQAKLLSQSYLIDPRTRLPNREALRERLEKFTEDEHYMVLKVSNFSMINEKYGYQVGDKLLLDLTEYFQSFLDELMPERSTLFSTGVAEWAVVFKSVFDDNGLHQGVSLFVEKLENENFEPYGLPDIDYLSVSIRAGLVSHRDFPTQGVDELMLKAIEARRFAERNNDHYCNANTLLFQDEVRYDQLSWLSVVSRAIINNQVLAYAQPIYHAKTHELYSYECLVRIKEGDEIINPGQFLPIIEDTHLYTRLSRQMLTHTFTMMRARTEHFSVNLAPQDFMSEGTLELMESLIKSLADPTRVGIEVLETEKILDYQAMIEACNQFRSLGASIIIDDFGRGYSNIDEIIKLEPQIIKLDGSLIRNVDKDLRQRAIAKQLIQLGKVLDAKTVAEFVHNEEVCRLVEDMGVDFVQGFYLGQPQPLD